ncbi:C4-dicarboxylate transport sensor protein DctB, putative [Oceanicola granulosus HTCC2516]|uniref:C4-dicarboxylate transport sensor protein DctB n=1 Tax=Oceanicola granulosus (strain ATCC BAA-861 / DSM 15982 / KCTC 12143 / HTCC2516) TaxID=314256 RepID=Q2CDD8_OCEGH|nr:ATP-binding protein [Oceanicola granulosus]EAR50652.1 C4-dicarboxylate transport sensor protein DctB, putative [Oceanicola granulosus HTCC2516]
MRTAFAVLVVLAIVVVYITNQFLTQRFTANTRNRAEVRSTLYVGNLMSELQRASIVPQLLARDPALIGALNSSDYTQSTQRLMSFLEEIDAASLLLLDRMGRVVAASDRNRLGEGHRHSPYFVDALRASGTVFTVSEQTTGGYQFAYARKIEDGGSAIGVIVVTVDLSRLERSWAGIADAVFVADSEGEIILSTEPRWRGLQESEALELQSAPSAIERAIRVTQDWTSLPIDAYLRGEAVMRVETRVPFRGWKMVTFTTYASVRERVNGVLALEIMAFAILLAGIFWLLSRKAASRIVFFQRESAELRQLNQRLQRAIAEREKMEKSLEVAEQTLAQSSKLAALGEMSAAVSHELNQPLAAMRTYLAGARLLLNRRRTEEALASFQRIDDLIERMGAITKQLKSYARKGAEQFEPVDARAAVLSALSMMEPQLKQRTVDITRTLPSDPVLILGDRLRLEQVIINLLRNALDATKSAEDPQIDILLAAGETVRLTVRDNGPGIEDLDALFEPFYTTKQPGDGVGLGLAISSGIVTDFGGRLTARNAVDGGAVFEVRLPIYKDQEELDAAE